MSAVKNRLGAKDISRYAAVSVPPALGDLLDPNVQRSLVKLATYINDNPPSSPSDEAYNATTWNGSLVAPTKNAIRDYLETLTGTTLPATYQPLDADLTALAGNSTNGLWARTGAGTGSARTITGTSNQVTVTNGDGISGNPTLSLPSDVLVPTVITVPNTGLHILDTNASHDLILTPGSDLTSDRTLTITTGDADRTLDWTSGLALDNARRTMTRQAVSTSGATLNIDMASGWHVSLSLGHNVTTFTVSNAPASGQLGKLTLDITASGSFSISDWPGTAIWAAGTPPTITASGRDTIILTTTDGGTNWRGYIAAQAMA